MCVVILLLYIFFFYYCHRDTIIIIYTHLGRNALCFNTYHNSCALSSIMCIIQLFVSRPFRGFSRCAIVLTAAQSIGTIQCVFFFFLSDSAPTFGLYLIAICLKNTHNSYGKFYILNIIHAHALRFILTTLRQYSNILLLAFIVKCDACT